MKNLALLILSFCFVVSSCKKDDNPQVEPQVEGNTLPSSFTKRVLLEDYTKHCQFCIPLNSKVDSMRNSYPNNSLIPVLISAYHSTEIPHFSVMNSVFGVSIFPVAGINRTPAVNSGSETGNLICKKDNWPTNIDAELLKSTDYGLQISSSLSGTNLTASVNVGAFTASNDLKLTVYIVENDSYYRNLTHVLTNSKGDDLSLGANSITEKSFTIDLNGLNLSKTSVVAFVHHFDETANKYDVLNVRETQVGSSVSW